jgi:hypothetical protein
MKKDTRLLPLVAMAFCIVSILLFTSAFAENILPTSGDLWDLSRTNPITILNSSETRPGFPVSKIFGSSDELGTWAMFADGKPVGYVDFVEWKTSSPIDLSYFNFYATNFASDRIMSRFSIYFSDDAGATWTKFIEKDIAHSYAANGIAELNIFNPSFFSHVHAKQYFRAEFVRCGSDPFNNGPVIHELDGFGKESGQDVSPFLPAIDTTNYGVALISSTTGDSLDFWVRVIDEDGITPTSHNVYVTYPGVVTNSSGGARSLWKLSYAYNENESPSVAFFKGTQYIGTNYTVPSGIYTFTVLDPDGNSGIAEDPLTVNVLQPFADSSLAPSNYGKSVSSSYDNVSIKWGTGPYVPYDDFSGATLDTTLWNNKSSGGGAVTVVNGEASFQVSNVLQTGISNLTVKQDTLNVTGIKTDVRVNSIVGSASIIRIAGYFLSVDGRNIWTKMTIGQNGISYSSEIEYPGTTTTYAKVSQGTWTTGNTLGKTITLKIDWDAPSSTLTYTADVAGTPSQSFVATYIPLGTPGPPTIADKRLDTRIQLIAADTCPTFTWPVVQNALSYRLRIWENGGNNLLWTANLAGTSYKLPPGILKPNSGNYQYQVNALDSHIQLDIDNATKSPSTNYINFYVDNSMVVTPRLTTDNIGVHTVNDEDGPHTSFYVRVSSAMGVPDNIKRVTVSMPGGSEKILAYNPGEGVKPYTGIYSGDHYANPSSGIYTFTVEDWDGYTHAVSEELTVSTLPPVTLISPKNGDTLDITKLTIAWDLVPGAAFYRAFIYDLDWKTVYAVSTVDSKMVVPEGLLKEETMYRVRVVARGEFLETNIDNSSHSSKKSAAANVLTVPKAEGTGLPTIVNNGSGVYILKSPGLLDGNPLYWLYFEVKISDPDGVPANIKSVTVKYSDPDQTQQELKLLYDRAVSSTEAVYWHRAHIPNPGDYNSKTFIFTVTDWDYNTDSFTDTLNFAQLPLPGNLSPANGAYVTGTTPKIDWDDVSGASAYRVVLYKGYEDSTDVVYDTLKENGPLAESEFTVPPGFLVDGLTYNYRVFAYREDPTLDADNVSSSPFHTTERSQFTVILMPDIDGDGLRGTVDLSPAAYSDSFSDKSTVNGKTSGTILIRGGQQIKIIDLEWPFGVLISAGMSGAGEKAEVSMCEGTATFKLSAGDKLIATCGSVTAKVLSGAIEAEFISQSSNEVATATLEPGKGLTFEPVENTFTALPDNTGSVAVVLNNEVVSVGKGTATKIVRIDIKPGTSDNIFNPNEHGALPVAIYGSPSLDVSRIVLQSLKLQGLNVKVTGKKSDHYLAHFEDLNEDGIMDLVVQFEDSNGWQTPGSDYTRLTGRLDNGMIIEGMDLIVIVH